MSSITVLALRAVLAAALAGSVAVQVWIVPAVLMDLRAEPMGERIALGVLLVGGVLALQVVAVAIWRLLTLAGRDRVFSSIAFRPVDVVIGALLVESGIVGVLAVLMAGGEAAPGVVGLICGAALVFAGVALVVAVMKALLRQAVGLRDELSEVI